MKKIILILLTCLLIPFPALAEEPEEFVDIVDAPTGVGERMTNEPIEGDVNGWGWKEEYGYYIVNNYRWDYLTVWYDPYELKYSRSHPYSSMSCEHIKNGTIVYPVNEPYTNDNGNTFIPFIFTDLKYSDYEDDGDGIYWLLLENYNGQIYLDHYLYK